MGVVMRMSEFFLDPPLYQQDQKRVYQEVSGKRGGERVMPEAEKSMRLWSGSWEKPTLHDTFLTWFKL